MKMSTNFANYFCKKSKALNYKILHLILMVLDFQ